MPVGGIYTPKVGAKAKILKTYAPVHSIMDNAAANIRDNARQASYNDGHPCAYHFKPYTDSKGFHHSDVFISWKSKKNARYFQKALNHLRNSI